MDKNNSDFGTEGKNIAQVLKKCPRVEVTFLERNTFMRLMIFEKLTICLEREKTIKMTANLVMNCLPSMLYI